MTLHVGSLLPILRRQDGLSTGQVRSQTPAHPDQEPVEYPFSPLLCGLLTYPMEGMHRYATYADLAGAGLDAPSAMARSTQNFTDLRGRYNVINSGNDVWSDSIRLPEGDYLDTRSSGVMFDHVFWREQANRTARPLLATLPSRDSILFTYLNSEHCLPGLRTVFIDAFADDDHPLSPELFRWTEGSWVLA